MRYAIFGDIHGNLEALDSALAAMKGLDIDEHICLGDIVGYGANPEECVNRVREIGALTIAGNHDHAVINAQDLAYFNQHARDAVLWTRSRLSAESLDWLRGLSLVQHMPDFTVVHGSLQSPEAFNYVQTIRDAEFNFQLMDRPLLFLGHSHFPLAFFGTVPMTYTLDASIQLEEGLKTVVNVGSIGQPRDGNPNSCFAVYDDQKREVNLHRSAYAIPRAVEKILSAGLPQALALRLALGK